MPTELAHRVARRHQAARALRDVPASNSRIPRMDGGRISVTELTRTLEPAVGPLVRMVFHRPPGGPPNEVGWAAVRPSGDVVSGTLHLRVSVSENMVTTWAEVRLDPPEANVIVDPSDLRLIERPADRVAVEYQRRGEGLVPVGEEGDGELVKDEGEQLR
jgi:hypothetical protein